MLFLLLHFVENLLIILLLIPLYIHLEGIEEQAFLNTVADRLADRLFTKDRDILRGNIAKQLTDELRAELAESGYVKGKVDEVVKKIETSLTARVHKKFSHTLEICDGLVEKEFNQENKKEKLINQINLLVQEIEEREGNNMNEWDDRNIGEVTAYRKIIQMIKSEL